MSEPFSRYDLKELLKDNYSKPFNLQSFKEYCEKRWCLESIDFILEIDTLRKEENSVGYKTKESLKEKVREIYDLYVDSNGEKALNITSAALQECKKQVENYDDININDNHNNSNNNFIFENDNDKDINTNNNNNNNNNNKLSIVTAVLRKTYKLIQQDLFSPFIRLSLSNQVLRLAQFDALWFLPRKTVLKGDGTVEVNIDNKLSVKSFFTYPDPVVESEYQSAALLLILLIIGFTLTDIFVPGGFPWLGRPKRFANLFAVRLVDYFLYDQYEPIPSRPFVIATLAIACCCLAILLINIFSGVCVLTSSYTRVFSKLGLVKKVESPCTCNYESYNFFGNKELKKSKSEHTMFSQMSTNKQTNLTLIDEQEESILVSSEMEKS
eukprot:Pgem_evm2s13278